mmetsp:Transcript_47877/g.154404  ORF Transcript_47877/g.154404 Transcript_47877/m.154404 type:complete len:398 (-) Transcript_47877:550-1743(-)
MRLDGLLSITATLLFVLEACTLHRARIISGVVASAPPRIPRRVPLPVLLSVSAAPSTAISAPLSIPIVPSVPLAATFGLSIRCVLKTIAPSFPTLATTSAPALAAASAPLPAPAPARSPRTLGGRRRRGGLGLGRLAGGVPNPAVYGVAQVSPKPQLRKRLHDDWPIATHTIAELLRLRNGGTVQQAQELCSAPLRSTIVCRTNWHAGIELEEVRLLKPICKQTRSLTRVIHAAAAKGRDRPALRGHGDLALADEAADRAEQPTRLREERLLWALEHLSGGLPTHGTDQQLQRGALLVQALPQLLRRLRESVECDMSPRQVGVLVRMECSRQLPVRVGHVALAVPTQVGATQSKHRPSTEDPPVLGTDPGNLVRGIADQDLLLLVCLRDGLAEPLAH